jgi:hypothetical protein
MFTALFVVSSVSSSTRGLGSSFNVALESVGRSVLGWFGFISDCCAEDSRLNLYWHCIAQRGDAAKISVQIQVLQTKCDARNTLETEIQSKVV